MRHFEDTKIKEEIPEACSSSSIQQQEYKLTRCGHALVDHAQRMQCGRDEAAKILNQRGAEKKSDDDGMACSVICSKNSQSGSVAVDTAFDDCFNSTHSEAGDTTASQLWTEEQTHINYYDLLPNVKLEIDETGLPVGRGLSFPDLLSVSVSVKNSNQNKESIIKTEDCPQLMKSRTITRAEEYASDDIPIKKEKHFNTKAPLRTNQYGIDILPRTFTDAATSRNTTAKVQTNQYYEMYAKKELPLDLSSNRRRKFEGEERHAIINAKIKKKSCSNKDNTECSAEKSIPTNKNDFKRSHESCSTQYFKKHRNINRFSCSYCNFKCNFKSILKRHTRTHTGEKPFACNVCDYRCIQNNHLKEHMRIHTGEKPFACDLCDHKCKQKSNLQKHMLIHTGEKSFACDVCSYRCNQKSALKVHMRMHTGEKPFACNMWDYKCNRKGHLTRYMRTHTR